MGKADEFGAPVEIDAGGRTVTITNPDKVMFPSVGPAKEPRTKLDLAQEAAISALDEFKDADEVGLWVFSTDLLGGSDPNYRELVPPGPIGTQRQLLSEQIMIQIPTNGTPGYLVAMLHAGYRPLDCLELRYF